MFASAILPEEKTSSEPNCIPATNRPNRKLATSPAVPVEGVHPDQHEALQRQPRLHLEPVATPKGAFIAAWRCQQRHPCMLRKTKCLKLKGTSGSIHTCDSL